MGLKTVTNGRVLFSKNASVTNSRLFAGISHVVSAFVTTSLNEKEVLGKGCDVPKDDDIL